MKIEQLMTPSPATCGATENLAQVVERMWAANCGIIPVVDDAGHVVAVITDRDVCIAAATRGLAPGEILAADMQRRPVVSCRPEDDVRTALALMKKHRVRRLPVTTEAGILHGIVSLDDIALYAGRRDMVSATDVLSTMKAIYAPPLPAARDAA
jgi:CBS domain-containing protein